MKIPKFNEFSKHRKVYENQTNLMPEPNELSDELPMANQPQTKPQIPTKPLIPTQPDKEKIKQPVETPQRKAYYEEEESGDSIQDQLVQLVEALNETGYGEASMEENLVTFEMNGEVYEIDFISETMSFAINGQRYAMMRGRKTELRTIQDVLNYFNSTETQTPHEAPSQTGLSRPGQRPNIIPDQVSEKKSYHRHKRKH